MHICTVLISLFSYGRLCLISCVKNVKIECSIFVSFHSGEEKSSRRCCWSRSVMDSLEFFRKERVYCCGEARFYSESNMQLQLEKVCSIAYSP